MTFVFIKCVILFDADVCCLPPCVIESILVVLEEIKLYRLKCLSPQITNWANLLKVQAALVVIPLGAISSLNVLDSSICC